jgi:hypothetical protein
MSHRQTSIALLVVATATAGAPGAAYADVTVQQQTSFDFAFIKAHGTTTEYTTTDKQRRDTDLHCEGFMSMFCGNAEGGDIIRLDRDLTWELEPKKKEYREIPFLTAAQRQAAAQQAQETMQKYKQCPVAQQPQQPAAPDTSKCEMSPPKVDVRQPGTHAMIAGHDTQLTQVALTQSCTNKDTGDVCDFLFALDAWLTQDQIVGLDERKAFEKTYYAKLGIDPGDPLVQKQMRQFLAPYADSLKQLSAHAKDFKGYSLKTAVRIAFGGQRCAAAKNNGSVPGGATPGGGSVVGDASQAAGNATASSAASSAGSAAGTAAGNAAGNSAGGSVLSSAASAFGSKLVSGLFNQKKADTAAATPAATSSAPSGNGLPPGMVQALQMSVETTSIQPGAVPPTQFDIPAGWKLLEPQATRASREFSCPNAGT